MKKNKFKMKISNMFQSSYSSCCSKNTNNDVLGKPQKLQHYQHIKLFSPRQLCQEISQKCPKISQTQENYKPNKEFPPRSKITEYQHLLHPPESYIDCLKCPPVSPLNLFPESERKNNSKRSKKTKTRKSRSRSKTLNILDFQGVKYNGLFSSDEESEDEEKTTPFFSSRSLSSVSSESYRRNNYGKTQKSTRSCRKNGGAKKEVEKKGTLNLGGSFAVVKRSNDPYNDFRSSMVEMIVENNIVSVEDLENMLQWFLILNSSRHHRIIVEVFREIWEALFSNIH